MNIDTLDEKQKEIWNKFLTRVCKCERRWPEAEKFIIKSPEYACDYARYVIKGRWPEAEETIIKELRCSWLYARDAIGRRWPEAEEFIIKTPEWACKYAEDVIKGRWPEAEETISKDPEWAYNYAKFVIKGRWPEAEETMCKHSTWWAYFYAKFVIRGRWPEAEETISKRPDCAYDYIKAFDFYRRSASLESNYLCDTSDCKLSTVRDYLSEIDWSDPANDFPIPKRLKDVLKKACLTK